MKSLRVWLLLLLALLLPVRGALAVAMQCATPGAQALVQAQLSVSHAHPASHSGHEHHHQAASPDGSEGTAHDPAAADKCNLCATSCSATALVSASMTVAEPQHVAALFPHLHAPPPSFLQDGEERPPRTT